MISIITPIYNDHDYIPATVASVMAQTRSDWEWVIVDDGSSDGTLEYCRNIARRDSRVRVLQHPGGANLGPGASRNLAIRNASGEFLAFLDGDDLLVPEKLERDIETFERHPRAGFLFSRILNWYDQAGPPELSVRNKAGVLGIECDQVLEPPTILLHVIRNLYDGACQLPATCSFMMRRSALTDQGDPFDPSFRNYEEFVMFTKVFLRHPGVVCGDIRSCYRRRPHAFAPGSNDASHLRDFRRISDWIAAYTAGEPQSIRDEITKALNVALERGMRYRRKMMLLASARRALPLQFREWLWRRYGKRGLVGR